MNKRKERERDIYRQELLRVRAQEKAGAEQILLGQRANARRFTRRLQLQRMKAEEEEAVEKALQLHKTREAQMEQEKRMTQELEAIKHSEFVEIKLRQKIRENSEELRALESKLRTAYVNKELAAQLAEKEADRLAIKYREELAMEMMRKQWVKEEEEVREKEVIEMERKAQYYRDLQKQEKDEEEKRHEAYQDFLREKMLIDEIVRRIHEEDQRDLEEIMIKMKKTKYELDEFRQSQEMWKEKECLAMEEENRRIIEFLKQKEETQFQVGEAIKERDRAKEAVKERLMKFIKEHEEKRKEQMEVYQDLLEEEIQQREEERTKYELQERLFKRYELQMAEAWGQKERLKRLAVEAENEAKERQRMLEEMEKLDKLEQLGEERKRKKKAEHRRAVDALLKQRQKERDAEVACMLKAQKQEEEEQQLRREAVEAERLQLLREHAAKLIGYLPRGILREDDLSLLGLELQSLRVSKNCAEGT